MAEIIMSQDDYDLCGWRVTSVIALPDLPRWTGDARSPDVTIEIGQAGPLDRPVVSTPLVQIDADGRTRFGVDGVAQYCVEAGRRVIIDPAQPLDSPDIRLFLLGSALGYLCHQRGVMPIHAATVDIDGEAVCFAGASGAGKSTLADAFARRGHAVLSDDVSPLDPDRGLILPSLRRIRMWGDAIDNAGWDSSTMERCRVGLEKFSRTLHDGPRVEPLRPRAIFHLRRQWDKLGGARFRRIRGRPAVEQFRRQVYRWRSLVGMAGAPGAMARSAIAAGHFPQHFIIERPHTFERLDATVDEIVATVRAAR
ncbi:MAG: Serine kinase [Sphingomonas bacterium]|uniref:hypothetical protein n=1 Tax=Sphingomonas bacterium TaxID=1895847 RepID=UPI00262DA57E|nr:hypothetical protein [Sphingomonas bacterium]MDB5712185.1 Serine kinase [Sphingomonas bacterium]